MKNQTEFLDCTLRDGGYYNNWNFNKKFTNQYLQTINKTKINYVELGFRTLDYKKIFKLLKDLKIDILYLADSLGTLKPKETYKITNFFKKYWHGELGIHAHNNMKLALKNSIEANKNGVKWIDSTILGMGRGPGNVRTEDLMKHFLKDKKKLINLNPINNLIKNNFLPLKKKYKWGPNKYYNMAGKYKIHPTYIQEVLSDSRYVKTNYLKIIQNLKKSDTKKYNPYKLLTPKNIFIGKPKGKWKPHNSIYKKDVLIVGPGQSVSQKRKLIEKFVHKNKLYVICLNTVNSINNSLINLRVVCHPLRIFSDSFFHSNSTNNLALPVSMLPNKIYETVKRKNKKVFDFGLSIHSNNSIVIKNNHCILPKPLAVGYSLAIAISGKANQIFLAGFDGYEIDDPRNDETNDILKIIKKKYKKNLIVSLTPTKYNLDYKSIKTLKL